LGVLFWKEMVIWLERSLTRFPARKKRGVDKVEKEEEGENKD